MATMQWMSQISQSLAPGSRIPLYLMCHHRSGWLQWSWGKPTQHPRHDCLQLLLLLNLSCFFLSYPAGCSTTQKDLCDPKLPFHPQNFSPCSFIPSTFSRWLMPGPPLLSLTDNTPTRLHSSWAFPDPKVHHLNYSHQHHSFPWPQVL